VQNKSLGKDSYDLNWIDMEESPEPENLLIPEFNKESSSTWPIQVRIDDGWVDTGKKKKTFSMEVPDDTEANERAFRQLLSARALSAIVIPDKTSQSVASDLTLGQTLEHIINVQNRLLPKDEQLPVYNEQGKCLYNPLTS
jgi:hypothetical protein